MKKRLLMLLVWFISIQLIMADDFYYLSWFRHFVFFIGLMINIHFFMQPYSNLQENKKEEV